MPSATSRCDEAVEQRRIWPKIDSWPRSSSSQLLTRSRMVDAVPCDAGSDIAAKASARHGATAASSFDFNPRRMVKSRGASACSAWVVTAPSLASSSWPRRTCFSPLAPSPVPITALRMEIEFSSAQLLDKAGEQADRAPSTAGGKAVEQACRRVAEALAIKGDVHVLEDVAFPGLDVAAIGLDQVHRHPPPRLGRAPCPGRSSGRRLWQNSGPGGKRSNQGRILSGMSFL